jgi:hypothetical protein
VGSILLAQGKHQEDTLPSNFAQILEGYFLQSLGEWNSGEKFFLNFVQVYGNEIAPPQVNADSPVQGRPAH